jgi:hypothetical protein
VGKHAVFHRQKKPEDWQKVAGPQRFIGRKGRKKRKN